MNKGLLIILVLVGAIALLCLCGVVSVPKKVVPPVVSAKPEPTIEERGEDYMLVDEKMTDDLKGLEERDYVDTEVMNEVEGVVGVGGHMGSAL